MGSVPEPKDLADAATDRKGPFLPPAQPVGSDDRGGGDIPAIAEVVIHEWLQREQVDFVAARPALPAEGPEIVGQGTIDPGTVHSQRHKRWTRPPKIRADRGTP